MKRDMDLVRAILLEVEAKDAGGELSELELGEWEERLIYGHAHLLTTAGFLRGVVTGELPFGMEIAGLTWQGYDLLDSIRDDLPQAGPAALRRTGWVR